MTASLSEARASLRGINGRILILALVTVVALAVVGVISVRTITNVTLSEHEAHARVAVEASLKIIEFFEAKAAKGELTQEAAQTAAKDVLRIIRYDGTEYVSAKLADGTTVVHGQQPSREGTTSLNDKDANGVPMSRDMIEKAQAGGGFSYYLWPKVPNTPPVRKATYTKYATGGLEVDGVLRHLPR